MERLNGEPEYNYSTVDLPPRLRFGFEFSLIREANRACFTGRAVGVPRYYVGKNRARWATFMVRVPSINEDGKDFTIVCVAHDQIADNLAQYLCHEDHVRVLGRLLAAPSMKTGMILHVISVEIYDERPHFHPVPMIGDAIAMQYFEHTATGSPDALPKPYRPLPPKPKPPSEKERKIVKEAIKASEMPPVGPDSKVDFLS
jgi:hypothetical protein